MAENKSYQAENKELLFAFRFLSEAIDARDPDTLGHMNRVARYCMKILDQLPEKDDSETREKLLVAAFLHDVGNLKIPEYILKKPGNLSTLERMEVELHPVYSLTILGQGTLAEYAGPVIRAHHERLDGSGYPDGLRGDAIPFCSRIIHIADMFDACTSPRIYRPGKKIFSDRQAIKFLMDSAQKGKTDKDIVHAFIKAYNNCDIIMARAAFYSGVKNPLLHRVLGEKDSPFTHALDHLSSALKLVEKMEEASELRSPDFWYQREYKILIRIATICNLMGKPHKALSFCEKAEQCAPDDEYVDHISLQKALAYHIAGKRTKALEIGTILKDKKKPDWFKATIYHLLAQNSLVTGHFKDAENYEMKALKCVARMKEIVLKDSSVSPLGVLLRWWNPDRINWLEGLVKLTCTRRHCYMGYEFTVELAEVTAHQFELTGNIMQRSQARFELARFLSNSGDFDKGIAIFYHEYQFAELIGDTKLAMKRAVWYAETYMRKGICEKDEKIKQDNMYKAGRILDKYLKLFGEQKLKKELKPYIDAGVVLQLWYENKLDPLKTRLPGILKSIKQSNTIFFLEISLIGNFIRLACNKDSSFDEFMELIEMAAGYNIAIRELEIYAEMMRRFSPCPSWLLKKTQELVSRMGGNCWLLKHPVYRDSIMS
ncbi:MAG: HD domain-containing protein [Spirochaetales bacterium]|nr:HD domain-containing protein [Spirochaetales bacterium]